MTETTDRIYFGGKGYQALAWNPLCFMEEYLAELASGEPPRSPGYLRPVRVGLARFATFAASEGIVHPAEITRVHILRYQAYLMTIESERGNRLGMTYQGQLLKYLRGWLNWLNQARHIGSSPWLDIRLGRVAKQPKPLDESEIEIEDLFAAHRSQAFSIPPFAFHRREVILVLLFGWGLRVRELQSLNVAQLAATHDEVTVRDNRGGTKTFAYGPLPKASAGRWLRHRGVHAKFGEAALLIDQSGGRLSVDRIRAIVVDCGVHGGITISPHRLRDTLGARLVDAPLPVERIMRLMGHTDRDQTRRSRESAASPASASTPDVLEPTPQAPDEDSCEPVRTRIEIRSPGSALCTRYVHSRYVPPGTNVAPTLHVHSERKTAPGAQDHGRLGKTGWTFRAGFRFAIFVCVSVSPL